MRKALTVCVALAAAVLLAQTQRPRPAAAPANAYVDPALCATCHQQMAETFAKTGMGRSFTKIDADHLIEPFSGKPFYHEASDSYFSMVQHDGKTSSAAGRSTMTAMKPTSRKNRSITSSAPATTAAPTST